MQRIIWASFLLLASSALFAVHAQNQTSPAQAGDKAPTADYPRNRAGILIQGPNGLRSRIRIQPKPKLRTASRQAFRMELSLQKLWPNMTATTPPPRQRRHSPPSASVISTQFPAPLCSSGCTRRKACGNSMAAERPSIRSSVVQKWPMPIRPIWLRPMSPNQSRSTG
jgi:hypothetical protein